MSTGCVPNDTLVLLAVGVPVGPSSTATLTGDVVLVMKLSFAPVPSMFARPIVLTSRFAQ